MDDERVARLEATVVALSARVSALELVLAGYQQQQQQDGSPPSSKAASRKKGSARASRRSQLQNESEDERRDRQRQQLDELRGLAEAGQDEELRKKLGNAPTDLVRERGGDRSETLLHAACRSPSARSPRTVAILLSSGADARAVDASGATALHVLLRNSASNSAIREILASLLEARVPLDACTMDGLTALHLWARQAKPRPLAAWKGVLDDLLAAGATVELGSARCGDTALHQACMHGSVDSVNAFLERGASLETVDRNGEGPLHYAVRGANTAVLEHLLGRMDPRQSPGLLRLARAAGPQGRRGYDLVRQAISARDMEHLNASEKRAYRRNLCVDEILTTEEDYLADLDVLLRLYVRPLAAALEEPAGGGGAPLPKDLFESIFAHIEPLRHVSAVFAQVLRSAVTSQAVPLIGKAFVDHMGGLRKYERVCTRQELLSQTLTAALSPHPSTRSNSSKADRASTMAASEHSSLSSLASPAEDALSGGTGKVAGLSFAKFCALARSRPESRQLDVADFLIKPFQRITKYPLLLQELAGYTEDGHPDLPYITLAVQQLKDIIGAANERKRFGELIMEVLEIQNDLAFEDGEPKIALTSAKDRVLLLRLPAVLSTPPPSSSFNGSASWSENTASSTKEVLVFVFSDLLLLTRTRRPKDNKLPYLGSEARSELALVAPQGESSLIVHARPGSSSSLGRLVLLLKTPEERARLLQALTAGDSVVRAAPRFNNHISLAWTSASSSERRRQFVAQMPPLVPNLGRYELRWDFADPDPAALPVQKGDVVVVYQKDRPSGWWYAELFMTGRRGFVPRDFLKKI